MLKAYHELSRPFTSTQPLADSICQRSQDVMQQDWTMTADKPSDWENEKYSYHVQARHVTGLASKHQILTEQRIPGFGKISPRDAQLGQIDWGGSAQTTQSIFCWPKKQSPIRRVRRYIRYIVRSRQAGSRSKFRVYVKQGETSSRPLVFEDPGLGLPMGSSQEEEPGLQRGRLVVMEATAVSRERGCHLR